MLNVPPGFTPVLPNGGFVPVNGPTLDGKQFAQMLQAQWSELRVVPTPHTNNLNPITCSNAAVPGTGLPIAQRNGVATADLFVTPPLQADKTKQILDLIADPTKSHFFNTDCVSCHTETMRAKELLNISEISGIDSAALPSDSWDVRNFGWSPPRRRRSPGHRDPAHGSRNGCCRNSHQLTTACQSTAIACRKLSFYKTVDSIEKKRMSKTLLARVYQPDGICRILALDGGGAKGFYTLGVLKEVEAMLDCPLYRRFDVVFGTSTGAIITALITLGCTIDEIHELYRAHVPTVMRERTPAGKTAALARTR